MLAAELGLLRVVIIVKKLVKFFQAVTGRALHLGIEVLQFAANKLAHTAHRPLGVGPIGPVGGRALDFHQPPLELSAPDDHS